MYANSCFSKFTESHKAWIEDIKVWKKLGGVSYPIIADSSRDIAVTYGMIDPDEKDAAGLPLTCRSVFIIGPDKRLKLALLYPATTGRNFNEILRAIDSLQLTARLKVSVMLQKFLTLRFYPFLCGFFKARVASSTFIHKKLQKPG